MGMSILLAFALTIGFPGQQIAPRGPDEQPLNAQLWYENPEVKGATACNRALRKRQEQRFSRRFKDRIARLGRAYEAVNGPDAPFDVIALGMCTRKTGAAAESVFSKALDDYEKFLRAAEIRWGVVPPGR
jgi:L-aminopeptidase/D-esterase-like protein